MTSSFSRGSYAEQFFGEPMSCVNAMPFGVVSNDSSSMEKKHLFMRYCTDAHMKK